MLRAAGEGQLRGKRLLPDSRYVLSLVAKLPEPIDGVGHRCGDHAPQRMENNPGVFGIRAALPAELWFLLPSFATR